MDAFTIKDIENLSGIKAHTIRIWEQRYSFLKPQRTGTNIRYYSNDELKTILNISLLNKYGFKISRIDKMDAGEIRDKVFSLSNTSALQERIINELIQKMIDLDIDEFEEMINNLIIKKGIEHTIIQFLFPFLERIGILWQTGNINPAQEHLITNVIRQKLIVGIEKVVPAIASTKTFLLFLPEGEHHELGLLFMYYLLKSRGHKTIYLGANVPLGDVEYVLKVKPTDIVYIHLTSTAVNFNFERLLTTIHKHFSPVNTIISGQITHNYKKYIPPGIQFKTSLSQVIEYVDIV